MGVLPGPRQTAGKSPNGVAFAAIWDYVGSYVGPSAVRTGQGVQQVGCVLRVVVENTRAMHNSNYREVTRIEVADVMLRPWLFDLGKESGPRQSHANADFHPS